MKVVALVSGGKDSCYNMVLCKKYGHEIVALANLLPAQRETHDLDSYMYQTVGHQLIVAYAHCMDLPLYRRSITGRSADQRLVYEDTEGDEVEDLYCLLAYVKRAHPDITAVASGAIASDYQRTRVERVCARLGLVSLAYLWHQPQAALLRRMIDAGIDAILVKIAAAGLTPAKHLGAHLASLPAQLHALRRLYGSNVCGEGGEYESLTLDCPSLFTHGRIQLDSWQAVTVSADSLAPVALLHPTAFHVEEREPGLGAAGAVAADGGGAAGVGAGGGAAVIEVPPDWLPGTALQAGNQASGTAVADAQAEAAMDVQLSVVDGCGYCSLTASVVPAGGIINLDPASSAGTAAALSAALKAVSSALPALGLQWAASLFVHLYVPSMAQFGAANAVYASFLPAINPPSRATVQLSGGSGLSLVVEVLFARQAQGRRVLHVQSISEWAPSCIGPYSQATCHQGLALFAGQIALDPPTMGIVGGGIDAQCMRCLLSCQRVAVAVRTDLAQSLLWCTIYCSEAAGAHGPQRAAAHLEAFLQGRLDTSTLEGTKQHKQEVKEGDSEGGEEEEEEEEEESHLDDYLRPPAMNRHWQPLLTFVTLPELPRGVLVEVQPVAFVVDESLAEDSSSSSDEEEEAAEQPQHKKAAALAARPRGSTMPGWIGRVQQRSGSSSSMLWSPGRLCRVQAWVAVEQEGRSASVDWQQAVQDAATELAAGVEAAGLAAADVAACKVYCLSGLLGPQGQQQPAQALTVEVLREAVAAALPDVQPAVVPVAAVGTSPAADCGVLMELMAAWG